MVVMLLPHPLFLESVCLFEHCHQKGGMGEVLLLPARFERLQISCPFLSHSLLVVDFLLVLHDLPDLFLHIFVRDNDESPRLSMCTTGGCSCSSDDVMNDFFRYFLIAEESYRPASIHHLVELF
uniref:Uncharacterized protein n=1 Tax=Cacopsylla melanoneura TaxID=428564 RepID=A0A8D8TGS8_9HEMI